MIRLAVLVSVFTLLACGIPSARAEGVVSYRDDLVSVRLNAAASSRLLAATPVRAGNAPLARVPESGPFGVIARGLGLALEPEFPAPAPRRGGLMAQSAVTSVEATLSRHWLAHVPAGVTPERAIELLRGLPEVEAAERVALVPVSSAPNDSMWSQSYYLNQASRRDVHALEAWDITRGDSTEIIAIIDTGVLLTHPDLAGPGPGIGGNIWTNAAEANGLPGVDDDGNGYIDDVHGWDFVSFPDSNTTVPGEDWRDEDNDPNDFVGHGTGVAGVAAAITNNRIGGSGAAPLARIMPLRVGYSARLAPSGYVDESAAARAIVYAARSGATVINCSFSTVQQADLDDALDAALAAGVTVVVAAGNNGTPHAMSDRPEVISVAALQSDDKVAMFSNTGGYVDVAAAGLFLSTTVFEKIAGADSVSLRVPSYTGTASGTSLAAPLVAAEVALIQADRRAHGLPRLDPGSVQSRIVDTADDISAQNPGVTGYGSGRVNFYRALADPTRNFTVSLDSPIVGGVAVAPHDGGPSLCVMATRGGHLVRVDGLSHDVRWDAALPGPAGGSPAVADLGGGRGDGIFVGVVSGKVCGYDADGNALAGWPVNASCPAGDVATPAIADLDGDGLPEVVWGDANGRVWAWHADGSAVPGFPARVGDDVSRMWIALADLDGDHVAEIVAAADDGALSVLERDGKPAPGWPKYLGFGGQHYLQCPPMVALLDADARPAIVTTLDASATSYVYVFNPDGSVRGSFDFGGRAAGTSAIADVEGDGARDLLVYRSTQDVWVERGNLAFTRITNTTGLAEAGSMTPELIVGNGAAHAPVIDWTYRGGLVSVDGRTGQPVDGLRFGTGTPTLADLDGDGTLELLLPDANAQMLRVYPTRAAAAGNERLWPTGRGNAARTGSTIVPGDSIVDDIPPREVGDLTLEQRHRGEVTLRWTAPLEGRGGHAMRYDVRRSLLPPSFFDFRTGTSVSGVPLPSAAGTVEHCTVLLPAGNAPSYFALVSVDSAGNSSGLSNVVSNTNAPPHAVTDLHLVDSNDTFLRVGWTSTGNSGWMGEAASYEVRASLEPIDARTFYDAPIRRDVSATQPAGTAMTTDLTGLVAGHRYWVAVLVHDSLDVVSGISNILSGVTAASLVKPRVVTGLGVTDRTETSLQLSWISTGNSGRQGAAAEYDIRASEQPIDSLNFGVAAFSRVVAATQPLGAAQSALLLGLSPGRHYWVAVRATDSLGFVSPLSNVVQADTRPPTRPEAVRDLRVVHSAPTSITVEWTSMGSAGVDGLAAAYELRASTHVFDASSFESAEITLSVPATQPRGFPVQAVLPPLQPSKIYWIAVRASDVNGAVSDVSNIVTGISAPLVGPAAVTDLRIAAVGASGLQLAWTSTGKTGKAGHAAAYNIYASSRPLDDTNFGSSEINERVISTQVTGRVQTADLGGLVPGRRYWVAVQSRDSLDYGSALSNIVSTVPGPLAGRAGTAISASPSPSRAPVALLWQEDAASQATDSPRIQIVDVGGRVCRTLVVPRGAGGSVRWDGANDEGTRMPAGIYFARILTRAGSATSRFVLLR